MECNYGADGNRVRVIMSGDGAGEHVDGAGGRRGRCSDADNSSP